MTLKIQLDQRIRSLLLSDAIIILVLLIWNIKFPLLDRENIKLLMGEAFSHSIISLFGFLFFFLQRHWICLYLVINITISSEPWCKSLSLPVLTGARRGAGDCTDGNAHYRRLYHQRHSTLYTRNVCEILNDYHLHWGISVLKIHRAIL